MSQESGEGDAHERRRVRRGLERSRVPAGRLERLSRIGIAAGGIAAGGLAEQVRRLFGGSERASSAFLSGANAERLAKSLSRMRGAAMKLGQMLSLEGDDILPPEFAEALAVLRAEADAMPEAQLRGVLARAYGRDWQELFREFDFEPIAAASIGQVHTAVALDGRELALKIQYPGVARSIESDVDNVAVLLRLTHILPAGLDFDPVIAEAKKQLRREADYDREARALVRYGELLVGEPDLRVPAVHPDLTRKRILAMDRLHGLPLEDLCGPEHDASERDRVGTLLYRLLLREIFEFRFVQTDPNFANYLWLPRSRQIGLLDLGAARVLPKRLADLYGRLFAAAARNDPDALEASAREIGFFDAGERADRIEALVAMLRCGCEPFAQRGVYDFGASTVPERVRELGMDLAFGKGFLKPPPPETIFLHRKLAGTFLLCARLGARVDAASLLAEFVEGART